jgi:hypothetical protein
MIKGSAFIKPMFGTVIACFTLYLLFSFSSWKEPIMGDEVNIGLAARGITDPAISGFFRQEGQSTFGLWHPPGYFHILALSWETIPGSRELAARIPGLLFFLLSLFLIYRIAYELPGNEKDKRRSAMVACALFAVNPLAVRGSLLLDIDGTLLNLLILVFIYAMVKTRGDRVSALRLAWLCVLFAATLWAKLTTPSILALSLLAGMALKKESDYALKAAVVVVNGAVLFLATWLAYSWLHRIDFFIIFAVPRSVIQMFFTQHASGGISPFVRNIWTLAVWTSPAFLLLSALSLAGPLKEKAPRVSLFSERDLALYGLCVAVVYLFVGGVTHSFPKYHFVALPVFCVLVARLLVRESALEKQRLLLFCGTFAFLAAVYLLSGDPLYTINYALKERIALGQETASVVIKAVIQSSLIFIAPAAALFIPWARKNILVFLLACALSFNISLSLQQQLARYNTVYCYGAQGVREAGQFVRLHAASQELAIAPQEILWIGNENLASYGAASSLANPDAFMRRIRDNAVGIVAYGITGNTLEQYRRIFNDPTVTAFLHQDYDRFTIGSYTVWLRRRNVEK